MRRLLTTMAVAASLAGASAPAATAGDDPKAQSFELANGLDVILRPIEGGGPIALMVLYDIGEEHDPAGRSGLGHLVEHLYVTAAAGDRPATSAEEWMARYGAKANAQTGRLYTVFAVVVGASELDAELKDAWARMNALRPAPADLERELPRIESELANMFGGIPTLAAQNLAGEGAVPLGEGARKGGSIEQLRAVTLQEVRERLDRLYKPANARLVLAGGFDPVQAKERIEALFGTIPRGEAVPAPRPPAASRNGANETVTIPRPAWGQFPEGLAAVAFRAPLPGSPDYPAFLVMVGVLLSRVDFMVRPVIVPVSYMPMDRPEVLILGAEITMAEQFETAIAFLRTRVLEAATPAPGEPVTSGFVEEQLGPFLGFAEMPDFAIAPHPYTLAFMIGRRAQLCMDPSRLRDELAAVTADDMAQLAANWLGPDKGTGIVVRFGAEAPGGG